MRAAALSFGLVLTFSGTALALPTYTGSIDLASGPAITQIQLRCDQSRCINPRTGVYSQSTCDWQGCRPLGGPVGRVSPGETARILENSRRRRDWDDDDWDDDRPRRRVYRYEEVGPRRRYYRKEPVVRYYRQPF